MKEEEMRKTTNEILNCDRHIWERLMDKPYDDDFPEDQKLNPYVAASWLHDTLTLALDAHTAQEVASVYKDETKSLSYFAKEYTSRVADMDGVVEEHTIRSNWAEALKNVKKGRSLSYKIGFGFSKKDISELAKLHKKNKFRRKIEDLLEDCNFHTENGDFSAGNYEKYIITT